MLIPCSFWAYLLVNRLVVKIGLTHLFRWRIPQGSLTHPTMGIYVQRDRNCFFLKARTVWISISIGQKVTLPARSCQSWFIFTVAHSTLALAQAGKYPTLSPGPKSHLLVSASTIESMRLGFYPHGWRLGKVCWMLALKTKLFCLNGSMRILLRLEVTLMMLRSWVTVLEHTRYGYPLPHIFACSVEQTRPSSVSK